MTLIFDHSPFDPDADRGPELVRVCVAMMCLSSLGLLGRFTARKLTRQPIQWDDWMIVLALPLAWGCCIIEIVGVYEAKFGRHAQYATPSSTIVYFKLLYALQIVYPLAVAPIKFSVLLFYRRIFHVPQTVKPLAVVGGIVMAWCIGATLPATMACIPVYSFWDMEVPRTCINPLRYYLGISIPNSSTDIAILLLPLPWIWRLVIPKSQKAALTFIFILGGFVTVISILRMVTLIQTQGQLDFTWSLIPLATLNVMETNLGIVLACLPSMRPLLNLLLGQKVESKRSRGSSRASIGLVRIESTEV